MIKGENLSFSYDSFSNDKNREVLKNVTISLEKGEKILVLGEPESGKTTLSHILSSLIPTYVEGKLSGKVYPEEEMKDRMGIYTLVPQNAPEFILTESVEDEIAFPLESLGYGDEEMEGRVLRQLKEWGLESLKDVSTSELSGGEKRRLMIATSLSTDPEYVIYDESFDDLDPYWRDKLRRHIKESDEGSLVFASRYLSYFDGLFHKIYLLDKGELKPRNEEEKEDIPAPKRIISQRKDILECRNIEYIHPRRSSFSSPFKLSVPSFVVKSGEIVALMGPNGSGKSTFSRVLCGLDEMMEGNIYINGNSSGKEERERSIGYMFQNPDYQIFLPTVRDELEYSLSFLKISDDEKESRLEKSAKDFSLSLSSTASLMSYGERKRLQSAIYYSLNRPFYILDELDSALSYKQAVSILEKIQENGSGIVLITHDEAFASKVTDRLYRAKEGLIIEE